MAVSPSPHSSPASIAGGVSSIQQTTDEIELVELGSASAPSRLEAADFTVAISPSTLTSLASIAGEILGLQRVTGEIEPIEPEPFLHTSACFPAPISDLTADEHVPVDFNLCGLRKIFTY
jgi:hypothetical protein